MEWLPLEHPEELLALPPPLQPREVELWEPGLTEQLLRRLAEARKPAQMEGQAHKRLDALRNP